MNKSEKKWRIVLILGALMTISPFAIDMYLPSFLQIAHELGTTTSRLSLTVSSYFLGLAVSQLFYGPLLDRFGRKKPLYVGLFVYVLACVGCIEAKSLETLIVFRFLQALGGCVAGVAAIAMVRDFFPVEETAKIISLLFLVLGVSPLLAPSFGSLIVATFGWRWIFLVLVVLVVFVSVLVLAYLPKGSDPDKSVSLRPGPVLKTFASILRNRHFFAYSMTGALSFASLFLFVGGSPMIFMETLHVSPQAFGGVFAVLTAGFIGSSQLNTLLLRKYKSGQLLQAALIGQVAILMVFLVGATNGWFGLAGTMVLFFLCLFCIGFTFPNASAMALTLFDTNVGSASALIGFLQIGIAGLVLAVLGILNPRSATPTVVIMTVTSVLALLVLLSHKRLERSA